MNDKISSFVTDKKKYYILLIIVTLTAMFLLSSDVFSEDRDGRSQIVDLDGGEEFPVNVSLKTDEELRLSKMLSEIAGVGKNHVMITWQEREETVSVFSSEPQIRKIQGVIVAAEGASNDVIKLAITEAVTSIYGIPTSSVMVFQLEQ